MATKTLKVNLANPVPIGGTFLVPFDSSTSITDVTGATGAFTDRFGNAFTLPVSIGATGVTVTNNTGKILYPSNNLNLTLAQFNGAFTVKQVTMAQFSAISAAGVPSDPNTVYRVVDASSTLSFIWTGSQYQLMGVGSGRPEKTQALQRLMGNAGTSSGSTSVTTQYYKIEAEAPFSRVRLHFFSKEAAALAGIKACIAATEEPSNSNVTNAVVPIVGGVQYNKAITSAVADMYGFRPVTFAGASTGTIPAGTAAAPDELVSDWIECASVPPTSGKRPLLLIRRFADPVTNSSTIGFGNATYVNNWQNAVGQDFYRQYLPLGLTTSDGVTTPANVPASVTVGTGGWFGVEFDYNVPVRSVLAIGDSITEGGGQQAYGFDNWALRAVNSKSTPAAPMQVFNGGLSSQTQTAFMAQLSNILASTKGFQPTDIIIPNWSINNTGVTTVTKFHTNVAKSLILDALSKARAVSAKVYIWTSYHRSQYAPYPNAVAAFDELQQWTRDLCATGVATLVDVAAGWNDATMLFSDNTHPTLVGIQYMADLFKSKL